MTGSSHLRRLASRRAFLAVLVAGAVLRLTLAYVVFPGQGFATDLGLFEGWATTLARVGPGAFYASAGSANYPPGYLYVLWLIASVATPLGSLTGIAPERMVLLLLKLPAIAADLAIAALLYRAARRWFGGRAGVVAAGLYLFVPVTWYDSALWGQVDAVGALVMLCSLLALVDGWSELAAILAVVGVLVKPQDAICLAVVGPVLLRRHLIAVGSGPVPSRGRRLTALDRRLGGLLADQGPVRLGTAAVGAAIAGIAMLLPFDITRLAPVSLADVPVVGHVAGLIGVFASLVGQYSVLTANAFNGWALVGPTPLASIAAGSAGPAGAWTSDSLPVLGGISASTLGTALLAMVALLVVGGLLIRDGRVPIVLGFAVLAFAFYALPTRVHERYLFAFFPAGALLAAGATAGVGALLSVAGYGLVGLLNAVNLHAVLGSTGQIGGLGGGAGRLGGGFGGGFGAGGSGGGGGFGTGGIGDAARAIALPFVDLVRSQPVVTAVAIGQTVAFALLMVGWLVVLARARTPRWQTTAIASPGNLMAAGGGPAT